MLSYECDGRALARPGWFEILERSSVRRAIRGVAKSSGRNSIPQDIRSSEKKTSPRRSCDENEYRSREISWGGDPHRCPIRMPLSRAAVRNGPGAIKPRARTPVCTALVVATVCRCLATGRTNPSSSRCILQDNQETTVSFGKRFSVHNNRPPAVIERNCERCFGTGFVRERGSRVRCFACSGRGKLACQDVRTSPRAKTAGPM